MDTRSHISAGDTGHHAMPGRITARPRGGGSGRFGARWSSEDDELDSLIALVGAVMRKAIEDGDYMLEARAWLRSRVWEPLVEQCGIDPARIRRALGRRVAWMTNGDIPLERKERGAPSRHVLQLMVEGEEVRVSYLASLAGLQDISGVMTWLLRSGKVRRTAPGVYVREAT